MSPSSIFLCTHIFSILILINTNCLFHCIPTNVSSLVPVQETINYTSRFHGIASVDDDVIQTAFVFTKVEFNNANIMLWADGITNVYFIQFQEETIVGNGYWQYKLVPMEM